MEIINKVELKLEGFDKCKLISDADCPLGQLFEYTTAVQSFLIQRIKDSQPQVVPEQPKVEEIQG